MGARVTQHCTQRAFTRTVASCSAREQNMHCRERYCNAMGIHLCVQLCSVQRAVLCGYTGPPVPSRPFPVRGKPGTNWGHGGSKGGAGKDFSFLFRFIPHIIFPILQICYLVSNRDRWRVQMRNSSCNSCNMNPPMQDLGFFC